VPALASHAVEETPPEPAGIAAPPLSISVVIRTQDRPASLAAALASVAAQTLRATEVVVVNDGGPNPSAVLAQFGELPLRLVQHERALGRSRAAQAGLEAARGEYVNFLDDDDLLLPTHLAALAAGVGRSGLPVAYSDVECVASDGVGQSARVVARSVFGAEFDRNRLLFENTIPIMAVLMRRDLALQVGGFDPDLDYFEDWDLWLRLAQVTEFHHCPLITATYTVQPALGQGLGSTGDHRWPHLAHLFDKHRVSVTGEAWAAYYRRYVEPSRGRVSEAESALFGLGATLAELEHALAATQRRADELAAELSDLQGSRLWRWLGWLWRVRKRPWARRLRDAVSRR
jgi:glycosyltransferase involved in cell wall biosynthesis